MTLRLNGSSSGYTEIDAPAAAGSNTLTLPTSNGSANQFLQNGSTAGTLEFGSLVSSDMPTGSILQVVQASTSTQVAVSTSTFTDTGLSASITPSSSSNKILVIVDQDYQIAKNTAGMGGGIRILRDSTTIHNPITDGTGPFDVYYATETNAFGRIAITKLDSPSSTSSITYKTQGRPYTTTDSGQMIFNVDGASIDGTSYITLMEVAA